MARPRKCNVVFACTVGVGLSPLTLAPSPVILPKACKNDAELSGMLDAHLADGAALAPLALEMAQGLRQLLARATGGAVFRVGGAQHQGRYAGVYELQGEGRTLVNGRPTYKLVGKAVFLYYGTDRGWWIGDDTSEDAGSWFVTSAALTPDRITETWEEWEHATTRWAGVAGAKAVRATTAARRQEAERVKALEAEARAAAVRARVEERRRSENAERQAEQQTIFTDPIADRDDVGNFMDQLK